MSFCPLRSTAEKEVECSKNCAWYHFSKEKNTTCEISVLNTNLEEAANNIGCVTNQLFELRMR